MNTDGSLDPSFGNGGTRRESNFVGGWGVAIQSDGKILVAGAESVLGSQDMGVARFTKGGVPDTAFGESTGTSQTHVAATRFQGSNGDAWPSMARAVFVQPDGKIVAVGCAALTGDGSSTDDTVSFAVARFNANGTPDKAFGDDTVTPTDGNGIVAGFAFGYDAALAGARQSDGDIVAAGGTNQAPPGQQQIDFGLARFTGAGSTGPGDFTAAVRHLPHFVTDPYVIRWSANNPPGDTVTFDVRDQGVRWGDKDLSPWRIEITKTPATHQSAKTRPGTTICFSVRAHSGGFTTAWSTPACTEAPLDDRSLSIDPPGTWGRSSRSDCYRGTYSGSGHGFGAELHLDGAYFKRLAVIVGKGPTFGTIEVLVDDKLVETISTKAPSVECNVLVLVKVFAKKARRDVTIKHVLTNNSVFVDGVGVSAV